MSYLRTFFIEEARAHGMDSDWNQATLEFGMKADHKEHVVHMVGTLLDELLGLLKNVSKLMRKLDDLKLKYEDFRETPSVAYIRP